MMQMTIQRLKNEFSQAWTVVIKDIRVYYLRPGMIMFGFLMPFFMFFSFSVRRQMEAGDGLARLLALTIFFTVAAAGPFIIPTERRVRTYDRLLAAPMSLITLLLGKIAVGAFFAIAVSTVALSAGLLIFDVTIAQPGFLAVSILLGALSFSALGLIFGSIPTNNPGDVQMPSTLLRWGLMFISGVFVPLGEMTPAARIIAYFSPLTYAQDLMNHSVMGSGVINIWLDVAVLLVTSILLLYPSILLHKRAQVLGD
jgi:ABC-2 type transport system permease protein